MRCHIFCISLGVAIGYHLVAVPSALGQERNYFFCHSTETYGGKVYVSALLKSGASAEALNDAFADYLEKKYGYADPRNGYRQLWCTTGMPYDKNAVTGRQGYITNLAALGNTVVETDWAGPPGTTVPEGPPPAPVVDPSKSGK